MVPASHLRVYEPLESFPHGARQRWARYISSDLRAPISRAHHQIEFVCRSGEPAHVGLLYSMSGEDALLRRVNGSWLVCPISSQASILQGILAFRESVVGNSADVMVPPEDANRAEAQLDRLRAENRGTRGNVATAAWHVPLRWLAAFDDAERIVTTGPALRAPGRSRVPTSFTRHAAAGLRYETELTLGVARLLRASGILADAGMDPSIVGPVGDLAGWMSEFNPESLLELDYGDLCGLIAPDELEADRSAGEIWACLEAMELGDTEESGRRYDRLAAWWDEIRAVEGSN